MFHKRFNMDSLHLMARNISQADKKFWTVKATLYRFCMLYVNASQTQTNASRGPETNIDSDSTYRSIDYLI